MASSKRLLISVEVPGYLGHGGEVIINLVAKDEKKFVIDRKNTLHGQGRQVFLVGLFVSRPDPTGGCNFRPS